MNRLSASLIRPFLKAVLVILDRFFQLTRKKSTPPFPYNKKTNRQKCVINLRSQFREDECLVGVSLPQITENGKYRLVIDCLVQSREIQSSIHALERLASHGRSKNKAQ